MNYFLFLKKINTQKIKSKFLKKSLLLYKVNKINYLNLKTNKLNIWNNKKTV